MAQFCPRCQPGLYSSPPAATARHGVGSRRAVTTECAIPTGKKFARRVGRELHVPTLVSHAGDDEAGAGPSSAMPTPMNP
jgi:hypothetical protein